MKSTIADIKQLFNVKSIAYNTNIDNLAEGQFGVFPEGSDTSVILGTTYATLPKKFRIVSKVGGKYYFSFDTIDKTEMFNQKSKTYTAEQINIWEGIIENCNCIDGVTLKINVDEQSLIQRDGLTWTHSDFVVAISPEELQCLCSCDGKFPVYENHVMTQLLHEKIVAMNSPFYTSEVVLENGSSPLGGIPAYIAANKAVNTDANLLNNTLKLKLIIKGKEQPGLNYRDLEVNYVYPRGVRLHPVIVVNNEKAIIFTETQKLTYEIGAGYDLRAEEFENMNFYTDLNFYPQLFDKIANSNLVYQFENSANYDTLTFEFTANKTLRNSGDKRLFGVLLGSQNGSAITNALVAMFTPV